MILAAFALVSTTVAAPSPSSQALWEAWPRLRLVDTPAACLRHADLVTRLQALAAQHPGRVRLEEIGRSAEGRAIHLLAVGSGERPVLLWSQMHGDEPSATPALLDVAGHLLSDAQAGAVLEEITLLMVPMLNPDGAERGVRRNAQGIDVNRDALNLATPEGRILKAVRDRYQPILGFNLHDQDRRTMVGETGRLATIALLAVAGDPPGTVTEGRLRAKRVCAAIVAALEPLIGPSIARYDEDWSPRAFGDNITAWGTPVVLVESGGLAPGRPLSDLTRLNFVALVSALSALAADDLAGHDPAVYERLTRNRTDAYADVVLRGGQILQGSAGVPSRADLAFDVEEAACPAPARVVPVGGMGRSDASRIVEVGDARFLAAGRDVDASGALIVPALTASVRGLAARRWLDPRSLDDMARLGVGLLRWHVRSRDVGAAQAVAAERAAPGRPTITVVASTDTPSLLVLARPPRRPVSRSLAHVLDALGSWRAPQRPFASALPLLTAPPAAALAPVRLVPDAPASFLVLRAMSDSALDAATLQVDAVYRDGRELPPPDRLSSARSGIHSRVAPERRWGYKRAGGSGGCGAAQPQPRRASRSLSGAARGGSGGCGAAPPSSR